MEAGGTCPLPLFFFIKRMFLKNIYEVPFQGKRTYRRARRKILSPVVKNRHRRRRHRTHSP